MCVYMYFCLMLMFELLLPCIDLLNTVLNFLPLVRACNFADILNTKPYEHLYTHIYVCIYMSIYICMCLISHSPTFTWLCFSSVFMCITLSGVLPSCCSCIGSLCWCTESLSWLLVSLPCVFLSFTVLRWFHYCLVFHFTLHCLEHEFLCLLLLPFVMDCLHVLHAMLSLCLVLLQFNTVLHVDLLAWLILLEFSWSEYFVHVTLSCCSCMCSYILYKEAKVQTST